MASDPYSTELLKLAADIPHLGRLDAPQASAHRVSRICGSEIDVDVALSEGRLSELGLDVRACALGQASASVLARSGLGATRAEIEAARDALKAMLKDDAAPPQGRFAGLSVLEGARDYRQRHGSILLAFEAAADAMAEAEAKAQTAD